MSEPRADAVSENEGLRRETLADAAEQGAPIKVGPLVPVPEQTPVTLLSQALAQGVDTETLRQFMDLQERYEANEARKAYAADMAKCQAKMPSIMAQVEGEKTSSYYAKLGQINQLIAPIYTRYGFSISFGHGKPEAEGDIRTTARVLHRLGHFEDFFIDLPPDMAGAQGTVNKTAIHARASSNSYGQRYIIKGIFNLSILSEDDDATAAGGTVTKPGTITDEQALTLSAMVDENGLSAQTILREFRVQAFEHLPAKKYDKAHARIKKIIDHRTGH